MLKKRIIPCLDIKDGRTVKGVQFKGLVDAGNPIELAQRYEVEEADELVFLDITATVEGRKTFVNLVKEIAKVLTIPFTVGGGISSVEDVRILLDSGADKISINSSAVKNPLLIQKLAKEFGNQCVVLAVDTKNILGRDIVHIKGGRKATEIETLNWIKKGEELGAGEILLTSMNADGTRNGFDIEITKKVTETVNIPVIASGGAGTMADFKEVFTQTNVTAALAAGIFHFNKIEIQELKKYLQQQNINIRI